MSWVLVGMNLLKRHVQCFWLMELLILRSFKVEHVSLGKIAVVNFGQVYVNLPL